MFEWVQNFVDWHFWKSNMAAIWGQSLNLLLLSWKWYQLVRLSTMIQQMYSLPYIRCHAFVFIRKNVRRSLTKSYIKFAPTIKASNIKLFVWWQGFLSAVYLNIQGLCSIVCYAPIFCSRPACRPVDADLLYTTQLVLQAV